jgi:cell wall-associated NlpC family hydrolase
MRRQDEVARPAPYRGSKLNPAIDVDVPRHIQLTERAAQVVKLAQRYLGTPYKWGGASPRTGFDCSGFVQWLYASVGVRLPRTTWQQMKAGRPVARDQLQPGDLLFFGNGDHEGLYIGNGLFIHATHTGDVVKISSLGDQWYRDRFLMARRVVPAPRATEAAA